MKKNSIFWLMLMCVALFVSSCSDDDTPDTPEGEDVVTEEMMDKVIATYVDRVVIPTYAEMETKVSAMNVAVGKFLEDGDQASLDAACAAWRAARKPWEESEAFLYGPAEYENLDPSLDSWPLDKDGIDQILATQDWTEIEGEGDDAQSLRGFHTIEYLLFEDGDPKKAENISDNERKYMERVSKRLLEDTETLHKAWVSGLNSEEVPIAFGKEMKEHTTNRTGSTKNVLGEFIIKGGIQTIAEEVGDAKIGEPYNYWKSGDHDVAVLQVESWYSWNSLEDYSDNIISIENSYLGGRKGNRDEANSLSALVKLVNPTLDTKVKAKIKEAYDAINGIPAPFRSNLDKTADIEDAMDACADLSAVFNEVRTALDLF